MTITVQNPYRFRQGPKLKITNSAGQPYKFSQVEREHIEEMQRLVDKKLRMMNALGYQIQITTLTEIMAKVTEQKFFEIAPADFFPVRVGQAPWMTELSTYRTFNIGGNFETGMLNLGGQNDRLAVADAGVDALSIAVFYWTKAIYWTIIELEQASRSGNWDLISAKEEARKKNWDLGIQRLAFLGARGQNGANGKCLGYLNQVGITTNTAIIQQNISDMDSAELATFCATVLEAYRSNCKRTTWPDIFEIPESDFNGLASQSSPQFPIKNKLTILEETFKTITKKPNFKILGCAYGDPEYHADVAAIAGKKVYTLSTYDEKSIRMDIPVPYTNTLANSLNNFQFQNAAYGGFTGVLAYRPLEMLYFHWTP